MKKSLLICILFLCNFSSFAQCNPVSNSNPINRNLLAAVIFAKLYEDNPNVYDYEASSFPNPFIDLQENTELNTQLKVLSYLRYDNGLTVYNYANESSAYFNPTSNITKIEALIYIMEAWNIHPDFSGSNSPYNDVPSSGVIYGYVNKAHDEGIISGSGNFNPFDTISIGDTVEILCEVVSNSSLHPVSEDLTDIDNYFIPNTYTPISLALNKGLSQGVFNHYAKDSFVIPDRKMSLNFSHFYSTQMVELPDGFFPIKPLSKGWSHTYNSYIIRGEINNDELFTVVWPDATIHIWNEDDNEYITKGVYDEFDKDNSTRIYITKKNQTRYKYEKLDSDRDIYYLTEIEDTNGNEIDINYENAEEADTKRIQDVEAPSGKKLEFRYLDDTDLIERIEDPIGRKIYFEYSGTSSTLWVYRYPVLTTFEDAKHNTTIYQYNVDNVNEIYLLKRIDLPRGNHISAEYEDNSKLKSYQVDNDDPVMVDVDFDYDNDNITTEVKTPISGSNNPFTENYTFNTNGLVTDYDSDTNNVQVSYPNTGVNVMLPTETNSNGVNIEYDYDSRGNVTRIDKENGDVIEEFEYDSDNNLTEYTDGEGNITKFFYDGNENLIEIEDALGNSIFFTYDSYGQLLTQTNQEGIAINYTYENDGAVSTMTAPANISSAFTYDGVNRLLQRDDNGLISLYEYDANDNVTQTTNSGGFATKYTYDQNDNLASIINPNNVSTIFTYDDEDRVIQEQFGNLVTQYDYGDEGYLEDITKPSGANIDYDYDNDGRLEETGTITDIDYNNRNLVSGITNTTGTVELRYDDLNRLDEVTTVHNLKVEYDYEDTGTIDDIEYPTLNGIELETYYLYDDKNRVAKVILNRNIGQDDIIIADYEYYDDDRIRWIDLGNNTRIRYSYDPAGRHRYIDHDELSGGPTLYVGIHQLNNRGNITESDQHFTPIVNGTETTTNAGIYTGTYDNNSHVLTNNGINHNVNDDGNTSSIGSDTSLTYDIDDRLTNYSDVDNTFAFKYNPYNQRVEKTVNGTTTKYVRDVRLDNILVELDSANNPLHYYIYSPTGMLLARMKPNGDLHYYHGDIRGSVVMMTDENADITHQYRYDDFGTITNYIEPANDTNFFRYVGTYGVEYDTDDLYYMRARYYKPSVGRFLTEDPVWSTNLYPYADNNPISKIDPNGKTPVHIALGVGLLLVEFGVIDVGIALYVNSSDKYTQNEKNIATGGAVASFITPGALYSGASLGAGAVRRTSQSNSSKNIALGVKEHLDDFTKQVNGVSYKTWGAENFQSQFLNVTSNPNNTIHFNLDGVKNVSSAIMEGAKGLSNGSRFTSWELFQVYNNSDILNRTVFYRNGRVVNSPF